MPDGFLSLLLLLLRLFVLVNQVLEVGDVEFLHSLLLLFLQNADSLFQVSVYLKQSLQFAVQLGNLLVALSHLLSLLLELSLE